jgi:diacylglycerol O-acyltransferase / wax synthase
VQQLSGVDSGFLYGETGAWHMHAAAVVVLQPVDASAGFPVERLRELIRRRLPQLGLLRYRVAETPLGIGRPVWVEVPDLDLEAHVKAASLAPPGGMQELGAFTARVLSRKLDRTRPLWEMWIVDGLEHGRVALVMKVHHACMDGVRGMQLYDVLFDLEPDAPLDRPGIDNQTAEAVPSRFALACSAASDVARLPVRVLRTGGVLAAAAARMVGVARSPERRDLVMPFTSPASPFNGPLTPARSVAFGSVPLEEVEVVRRAYGVTFNDVVLAACTGALRIALLDRGIKPERPLIAQVPVGVHGGKAGTDMTSVPGNFVSAMGALLPVHLADPVAQLDAIHSSTVAAKTLHHALGDDFLLDVVGAVPPVVISAVVDAYAALRLDRLHPPIFNVLVSNVRGSPVVAYSLGARLVATYPLGPLIAGCGLNITVLSYVDRVDIGLVACPDVVDDVWQVADAMARALHSLSATAHRGDEQHRSDLVDVH